MLPIVVAALSVGGARAALPKGAHIDATSMRNLLDGDADICGDVAHSTSCLKLVPCAEVDNELDCTLEDPVWIPGLVVSADGAVTGRLLPHPHLLLPLATDDARCLSLPAPDTRPSLWQTRAITTRRGATG